MAARRHLVLRASGLDSGLVLGLYLCGFNPRGWADSVCPAVDLVTLHSEPHEPESRLHGISAIQPFLKLGLTDQGWHPNALAALKVGITFPFITEEALRRRT